MTKCREAPTKMNDAGAIRKEALARFQNMVVTPRNIPEFTIPPPRIETDSISGDSDLCSTHSSCSLPCSANTSPGHSPRNSLQAPSPQLVKSAPVSPTWSSVRLPIQSGESASYNDIDKFQDTNIDPQSLRAMGLQHFKTKTSFGFDTLAEAPHTRRKESLFHDNNASLLNASCAFHRMVSRSLQCCKTSTSSNSNSNLLPVISISLDNVHNNNNNIKPTSKRRNIPSLVMPLGVLSPNQCTMDLDTSHSLVYTSCSSSSTTPETHTHKAHVLRTSRSMRKRSSYTSATHDSSDSSPDNSSPDRHHQHCHNHRRNSGPLILNPDNINTLMHTPSATQNQQQGGQHHNQLTRSRSMGHTGNTSNSFLCKKQMNTLGEVKLSVQYMKDSRQLRVILLKAVKLGQLDLRHTVSPYVKLYLSPGKLQKQCSAVVKQTRSPVFSEEFYFNEVELEELQQMSLQAKVG